MLSPERGIAAQDLFSGRTLGEIIENDGYRNPSSRGADLTAADPWVAAKETLPSDHAFILCPADGRNVRRGRADHPERLAGDFPLLLRVHDEHAHGRVRRGDIRIRRGLHALLGVELDAQERKRFDGLRAYLLGGLAHSGGDCTFFAASSWTNRNAKDSTAWARTCGEFSPTPAVKTSESRPPRLASMAPISERKRCTYTSNASCARASPRLRAARTARMSPETPETPRSPDSLFSTRSSSSALSPRWRTR